MTKTHFNILGKDIPLGGSAVLELEIAKLHTRNTINVPVIINRGKKNGPTVLLLAGVHGDEVNGIAIVRKIIKQKWHKPIAGTIICIPVFNVFGFLNLSREFPDGRDLNRVFPGAENGSLASQFAYKFTKEIAPKVDYVLDFHAGGATRANAPQVRCAFEHKNSLALAKVFGAPFILNASHIPKTIRETLDKMGKTILLYEGGKSNEIDIKVVNAGVKGAINVMRYLGLLEGELEVPDVKPVVIKESKWIRAPFSGMFTLAIQNASCIKEKDIIGRVSDPYGEFEKKIKSTINGHVICVNTAPIVNKGDALIHISTILEEE